MKLTDVWLRVRNSPAVRRLAKASLWSIFGALVSRILLLLTMIMLARLLGRQGFGEFGMLQATLGVAGLMSGIGLGSTAARFIAQYAGTDAEKTGRLLAMIMVSSVVAVFLVAIGVIVASGTIAQRVLEAAQLQTALVVGALLMAATAFRGVQNGILAGFEKFDSIAQLNIIDAAVCIVSVFLLSSQFGVAGALLGVATGSLTALILGSFFLFNHLQRKKIKVPMATPFSEWRILMSYSTPTFLGSLVATPTLWLAMTLVARSDEGYLGIGLYNAAYQWHGPIIFLPMMLASVSIPVLVQEWEMGNRIRFRRIAAGLCGLVIASSAPPVLVLTLFREEVMMIYGAEYLAGTTLLVLLLVAAPLHGVSKITSAALLAMNLAWSVFWANVVWGVVLIFCVIWLLPDLGVLSLGIGFLLAYAALTLLTIITLLRA